MKNIIDKSKWVWMPHAGHFICGDRCVFHLNTYVNGYIVSTVGEMRTAWNKDIEDIGSDRKYETMVFKAKRDKVNKCCPWTIIVEKEVDMYGYNTAEDAYKGHLKLCKKWSTK